MHVFLISNSYASLFLHSTRLSSFGTVGTPSFSTLASRHNLTYRMINHGCCSQHFFYLFYSFLVLVIFNLVKMVCPIPSSPPPPPSTLHFTNSLICFVVRSFSNTFAFCISSCLLLVVYFQIMFIIFFLLIST